MLALSLAACAGSERIPPPATPPPSVASPTDAIPGELDLALRIDLARMRAVLGERALTELADKGWPEGASGDPGSERWLAGAMAHADTIWIALRPAARAELTDSVTILRGRFSGFDPRAGASSPWQSAIDLGGGWRRYDRTAPPSRAAPARIYARGDELLVLVSSASLDSAERQIELRSSDPHLEPAGKGVISLEARGRALRDALAERSPSVARFLARAERLRANADLDTFGLSAELELTLETASDAKTAADALGLVAKGALDQGGLAARLARGLHIEAVGTRVVARITLAPDAVAALLGCAGGGGCD
jgi:hypothetical protein